MSSNSGTNSWTILPSEGPVAETLKPLAGGNDHQEETDASAAGSEPANGMNCADMLPVKDHLVSGENPDKDQHNSEPVAVCDALPPSAQEISDSSVNSSEVLLDDSARLGKDLYSSSDSYTLLTPSNDDLTPSPLSTEAPEGVEFVQAEETPLQNQTDPQQNGEELHQEDEESDQLLKTTELGKRAGWSVGSEESEKKTEKVEDLKKSSKLEDEDPEVRKRKSILASLEEIGRREEDETEEEEVHPRQQHDDDSGFTVNKCILGAIILLGIGTIFFSESDYETRENLKDTGKQEWLNPESPPHQADAQSSELLTKLNAGEKQISELQAQLQAQKEELDVAQKHAAEGAKEQLQIEEMKKENSRLKSEMASFSALQEENQKMKRELESVPTLQKELETLRSTLNELKITSAPVNPPSSLNSDDPESGTQGHAEKQAKKSWHDQKQKKDTKREKHDLGEKMEKNERERSEPREEGKSDWKRDEEKEKMYKRKEKQKQQSDEAKQWKGKEWKEKENKHRQVDERKPWKDEGKKEWIEKSRKTDWESKNERKKVKHEKENVGERRTARDDKMDWKKGKDHMDTYKSNENWKGEKEWRKGKDRSKEIGKEQIEWKEKGEKNKGKKDTEWTTKKGDAWKEKAERKEWESDNGKGSMWKEKKNEKNEQMWKNKKEEWKNKDKDWKKDGQKKEKSANGDQKKDGSQSEKQASIDNHHHHQKYVDHKHKPTIGQPEYWVHQRARLQHSPKPPQQCDSMETCAQVEKLLPVPLADFDSILQSYLTKAVELGVEKSKAEELRKLTTSFFKDGMFVHHQMSFEDFVEDVGDILEDMVEENGEDSAMEDEMEEFEKEIMKRFSLQGEKKKKVKGEKKEKKEKGHV